MENTNGNLKKVDITMPEVERGIIITKVEEKLYTEEEVKWLFEEYRQYIDKFPSVRTTKSKMKEWFKKFGK